MVHCNYNYCTTYSKCIELTGLHKDPNLRTPCDPTLLYVCLRLITHGAVITTVVVALVNFHNAAAAVANFDTPAP